jgi:xanthine dehydrogenase YagR molybdenum-binding subunit
MRDGDWLVGWGCATATYPTQVSPAAARVKLTRDGKAHVAIAAHDVGTGASTVIAQAAADRLGIGLDAVTAEIGDSALPPGPIAGGSVTTASACSAVIKACDAIAAKMINAAIAIADAGLAHSDPAALRLLRGRVEDGGTGNSASFETVFEKLGVGVVEEYAEYLPDGMAPDSLRKLHGGGTAIEGGPMKDKVMYAFGAEFVEVRVHALTREIRVPRAVGAFAAGRIMNPRTARSQLMGGMIWGISSGLLEITEIDRKRARYVNDNLADYLVPVNADVNAVEVILLSELDPAVNPAGVKGLGELANVGMDAAVANAIFDATGKRIRRLPIRIDDLIGAA